MKLSFDTKNKHIDFLDGLTTINANDVMWQWLEVYLDEPLTTQQSLWVSYSHPQYGEHTHEILFEEKRGKFAKAYIPDAVIRIPGEWVLQLFVRQYSILAITSYTQFASNKTAFVVENGLPLDEKGAPVTNATVGALYAQAKQIIESTDINNASYEKEVLRTDSEWQSISGDKVRYRIQQNTHGLSKIHSVDVKKKGVGDVNENNEDFYQNMLYSYKTYSSNTVSIILDKAVDMKILIKGER